MDDRDDDQSNLLLSPDSAIAGRLSASQRDALERLQIHSRQHQFLAILTGETGLGKSTIRELLISASESGGAPVRFSVVPALDKLRTDVRLLKALIHGVDQEPRGRSGLELTGQLLTDCRHAHAEGLVTCFVIDDAHVLSAAQLEVIHALLSQAVTDNTPLSVVLIGEPQLAERITRRQHLNRFVTLRYSLNPLTRQESAALIERRLLQASSRPDQDRHGNDLIDRLHIQSRGNPSALSGLVNSFLQSVSGAEDEQHSGHLQPDLVLPITRVRTSDVDQFATQSVEH